MGLHGDTWGDKLSPYLIRSEGGPGERLDALVATEPTGRYIAAIQRGKLWIIDVETDHRTDLSALGASIVDDGDPLRAHRVASFDASGKHVVYLGRRGSKDVAIVRELDTGNEVAIDPGEGLLWRAELEGPWVIVEVIAEDTDKNGRLEFPVAATSLSGRNCRAPIVSYSVRGRARGDEPETRYVRISGGTPRKLDASVVAFMGEGVVLREASGALLKEAPDGSRSELAPASCGGRILGIDEGRGAALVACHGQGAPLRAQTESKPGAATRESPVELLAEGKRIPLALSWKTGDKPVDPVMAIAPSSRLLLWSRQRVIDLEKATSFELSEKEEALMTSGAHLLLRSGQNAVIRDVDSGKEERFAVPEEPIFGTRRRGSWVLYRGIVLNMSTGERLGRAEGTPLGLRNDGMLLYDPGQLRDPHAIPRGPLWWAPPKSGHAQGPAARSKSSAEIRAVPAATMGGY